MAYTGDSLVFDFGDPTGEEFYDPFDGDGGYAWELHVPAFSLPDGDFRVSDFGFPDGDENLVVEYHASQASRGDPILETLDRSFDSDEDLHAQLVSPISATLDLAEDTYEEEAAGDGGLAEEFSFCWLDHEPRLVFDFDPRPVTGDFQTLVDADGGGDVVAGEDDMAEVADFDLRQPAFRMQVEEDIDADDTNLLDVLHIEARQLLAARAALPEVAATEEEAGSCCAVCKDDIAEGQLIVRLPCKHFFHDDCIRPWLVIRNTCPVCRRELSPAGDPEYNRLSTAGGESHVQHGATAQI